MKKFSKTPLATAMGTLVLSSLSVAANADSNPFAMTEMSSPYMQLSANSNENNPTNNKVNEGGCASNIAQNPKQKAAANAPKNVEGACGEGKCGAMMSGGKMNKGMESTCGAMMKGKEGACGMMDMKHGEADKSNHDHGAEDKTAKSQEHSCGAMMSGGKDGEASCGAMMKGNGNDSKVDADKAAGK